MHLAAWGKVDTARGNAIDMMLGIPGPSLLPLGLTDLPEDYVFVIPMRGTSQHPEIDIVRQGIARLPAHSVDGQKSTQLSLSVMAACAESFPHQRHRC